MKFSNTAFFRHSLTALDGLIHLAFPNSCLICESELSRSEKHLCSFCQQDLPRTYFESYEGSTPMDQLFWGRVQVEKTYAYLLYKKLGVSTKILTSIKYQHNPELAVYFGKMIANTLRFDPNLQPDVIVPVPLHSKKQFLRGYNQSHKIAEGISDILAIPINDKLIKRNKFTETQTKKSRYQRWSNVANKFGVKKSLGTYSHVLLVDDVITTAATLEAIIQEIHNHYPQIKVSVVTLAIAS